MESDGTRRQAAMETPAVVEESERGMGYPVRGQIVGVKFKDQGGHRRTVVDCYVMDRTGRRTERGVLYNVPLLYPKLGRENGEEWTPEEGDFVAIGFFNRNLRDPFVFGCLAPPDNAIQAASDEAPRSYRKRSGTSEEIDPGGNRTTIVHGHETVTVETGDVSITVVEGKCTVLVKGKTAWTSEGTIELDGDGDGTIGGVLQEHHFCQFHGNPFAARGGPGTHYSSTVKASKE